MVEEIVEHVVQQCIRSFADSSSRSSSSRSQRADRRYTREQLGVRQRDEEVMAEEHVELGRVPPLDGLVVRGKWRTMKKVGQVVVDLQALALRKDVLDVELVEPKRSASSRSSRRASSST